MLSGFDAALAAAKSDNYTTVQQLLKEHASELATYPCVDGSFKKVYSLPGGSLALACFREKDNQSALNNGKELLTKEKQLLDFLKSMGLQTVNIHGEPFEINNQYAILMSWISDAHFIDVKDQEASIRKLISVLIGVSIPSGEGWVLRKNMIEAEISEKLADSNFSLDRVKARTETLHTDLMRIQEKLLENRCLIADLQLLINNHGVFIIDPIDVVTMTPIPNSTNMFEYRSILDQSVQNNSDFVKLLYDGRRMMEQCIAFCREIMTMSSKEDFEKKIFMVLQAKELISPRSAQSSLQKMLLIKSLGSVSPGSSLMVSPRSARTSPVTSPRPRVQESSCPVLKPKKMICVQDFGSSCISTLSAMTNSLLVLPEEPQGATDAIKENVNESPTKLLAFQFRSTKLSEAPSGVARRLFDGIEQKKLPTDEPGQKPSSLRQPQ